MVAALLATAQATTAANDAPGITVNHAQAGTLDASGWTDATSLGGGFSGRFPCLYDDYAQTDPAQPELRLHWLNCQREDGVRFAIMRSVGQAPEMAKAAFDSFADDKKFSPISFKGMSGYSYATMADGMCARVMVIWTGQNTIMAMGERTSGDANCLAVLADTNAFIESLEVER